jgi:tRNA1Val (adenine37-N6)-methyltransferase
MKVGTDAVLLGAWCRVGPAKRILDIGTGSGVIALMLAQRSAPEARIDAVEQSAADVAQAAENFRLSPWSNKLSTIHCAIQEYQTTQAYDLIVCNPPYFTRSLLPPETRRQEARHDSRLRRPELITAIVRLLHPEGCASLILPTTEASDFVNEAGSQGLYLTRVTQFRTRLIKPPERQLMEFKRTPSLAPEANDLVLYEHGDNRSLAYRELTAAFYL